MFRDLRVPLAQFVRETLGTLGAEWEEGAEGISWALLPGEIDLRCLTFEREVAQEDPKTELVAYGSPFIEKLAHRATSHGLLGRGFAAPFVRPPPRTEHAYHLRAEKIVCSEWTQRLWTTWVFAFGVGFIGEFRGEALWLIAVDAATLRLVRRFEEPFSELRFSSDGPTPSGDQPFAACYAVAHEQLTSKAAAGFKAAQRDAEEGLQKELARLDRYYRGLLEEQEHILSRAPSNDPRRVAILARHEAIRLDNARMETQTRERYELELKMEAIGAFGVIYPRLVSSITLLDKGASTFQREAIWDPVLERFEPLICPSCRRPTYTLEFCRRTATCGCA